MPPNKQACKVLATGLKLAGEIGERIADVLSAVQSIINARSKSKFGVIDIVDAVGAEIISAISVISAQVSEGVLGSISKAATGLMDLIFSNLLKICLAYPTSIFSLIAIPHNAATKAVNRERLYLKRAEKNLEIILSIILRWTKGKSGNDYRNQMLEALPYIKQAFEECENLIQGLNGEPIRPGESGNNSVFKEDIYDKIKKNLNSAINISRPTSLINQKTQIAQRLAEDKDVIYKKKAEVISKRYKIEKGELSDKYKRRMTAAAPNSGDKPTERLSDVADQQRIMLWYDGRLEALDAWKKTELAIADSEAEFEALLNKDTWINAFTDTAGKFMDDMRTLGNQLDDMIGNIHDAYAANVSSQLYCNNIHNMRNIIVTLIGQMITFMRETGNVAGAALASAVEQAQTLMEVCYATYSRATNPSADKSASSLASSLALGHGTLLASDAILNSAVNNNLIDIINSDDVLQSADDEFDEFITRLEAIPDWDGKTGVWSVDITNGALSPYIQLISDITEMLEKVPVLSISRKEKDQRRVKDLVKGVRKDMRVLLEHNSVVNYTLSSYTPYMGSETGDLMKILASAGLLNTFAETMSLTSLVTSIASNYKDFFGDEWPTRDNCSALDAYPELFEDKNIQKGETNNKLNSRDPSMNRESQAKLEKNSNDRKINQTRDKVAATDYTKFDKNDPKSNLGYPGQDGSLTGQ